MAQNGFPDGWPDFTAAQRRQLKRYGVTDEQMRQLRGVLRLVRLHAVADAHVDMKAARDRLQAIERLATELSRKLLVVNASAGQALAMLDCRFWMERTETDTEIEGLARQHYSQELKWLVEAAKTGREELPARTRPGPRNTASPKPVRAIHDALRLGWMKGQGNRMLNARYPDDLMPSEGRQSAFRGIVGICYQAVGGNKDPLRAIQTFMAQERKKAKALRDAIE